MGNYNNCTEAEIIDYVTEHITKVFTELNNENSSLDLKLNEVRVYGSRSLGTNKAASDLDILIHYSGDLKEYVLFNILNEEEFWFEGMLVDFNPIRVEESGDCESYLKHCATLQNVHSF